MAKKTKEKGRVKNTKEKVSIKDTKDEKFNFDEEIIIGLKRTDIDNEQKQLKEKNKKSEKSKKSKKNKKSKKSKKPVEKITKKERIAQEKRRAVFKLLKWTTFVCIVIGGIVYALLSPIFNIKTVSVSGNSQISTDEIISLSKIELEQNMFKYKKSEIINNIKQNAYIDMVKVSRKFPDTIEIIVSERTATYKFQFVNAYAFINNQGYILEISNRQLDLPLITGLQTKQEEIKEGARLCTEDLEKLGDVLKIMESATSNGINNLITKIDITDSDDYKLTMQKSKKTVHLGDTSNLSTKMLWIITFNELEGNTQGEIMLNMNLNDEKNKPYFRKSV